jgi:hypothetical protein
VAAMLAGLRGGRLAETLMRKTAEIPEFPPNFGGQGAHVAGVTGISDELAQDAKSTGLHCAAEPTS